MIRRLTNLLVFKNADLSLINKCQHLQENSLKVTLTEFKRQFSSRKTNVEDEFQEDKSFGVKNLEQVGIINKHMSWPQYNRIIYPPTEDGTPMKNPVSIHF
jgi:hypothetical protein